MPAKEEKWKLIMNKNKIKRAVKTVRKSGIQLNCVLQASIQFLEKWKQGHPTGIFAWLTWTMYMKIILSYFKKNPFQLLGKNDSFLCRINFCIFINASVIMNGIISNLYHIANIPSLKLLTPLTVFSPPLLKFFKQY